MKWPTWLGGRPEQRISSRDPYLAEVLGGIRTAHGSITVGAAEQLATVLACVNAVSGTIASLDLLVFSGNGAGRTEAPAHPLARLARNGANRWQAWPDFVEWLMASTLLRGNGLAEIITDESGVLRELRPILWETVHVEMVASGRLIYNVSPITSIYGATRAPRRLLDTQVVHLRDRSDDGLVGRSRLSRAAETIGGALSVHRYSTHAFENVAHPSGVLMLDHKAGDDQLSRLAKQFREAFTGSKNAAKAMVLDQGVKWETLSSMSPEDAELLASRRFSGEELCRLFDVPPPIVGDLSHGTFTNSETLIRFFAQSTITRWCRKLEATFSRSLFTEDERASHELEFDLSTLLRGDPETRWKSHEIAVKNRILTPNEARLIEGWAPRPGGDDFEPPAPRAAA